MKQQLKQIVIALAVAAICALALFAVARWLTRPQSFADIFPADLAQVSQCQVLLEYDEHRQPGQTPVDLSTEQLQELLDRLGQTRYSARFSTLINHNPFNTSVTGIPVTIDPYARLFLEGENDLRVELMLCGDTFVVNPLDGTDSRGGSYDTAGGARFQEELVTWLEQQTSTP